MLSSIVTDVIPIEPGPWEPEGADVPVEGPRELAEWLASLDREGASWDESASRTAPWGAGYAVIVAVRSPGPRVHADAPPRPGGAGVGSADGPDTGEDPGTIRYFMISGDDVRLLAFRATGAVARFAERLGYLLGPALGPIAARWKEAWRQTFVGIDQVAELLGVERAAVERWAREDKDFPLAVVERARGPVYVREEIVEWLERSGRHGSS
ncbi:MAG: helix-turn-helix transcriptional regulator [Thermoleophilia bacterium]